MGLYELEGRLLRAVQDAEKMGYALVANTWGIETDSTGCITYLGPKCCCLLGAVMISEFKGGRTGLPSRSDMGVWWSHRMTARVAEVLGIREEEAVALRQGWDDVAMPPEIQESPYWHLGAQLRVLKG